jgi:hypothetical protein
MALTQPLPDPRPKSTRRGGDRRPLSFRKQELAARFSAPAATVAPTAHAPGADPPAARAVACDARTYSCLSSPRSRRSAHNGSAWSRDRALSLFTSGRPPARPEPVRTRVEAASSIAEARRPEPPRTGSPGTAGSLSTRTRCQRGVARPSIRRTVTRRTHCSVSSQRCSCTAKIGTRPPRAPSRHEGGSHGRRCTRDVRLGRARVHLTARFARRLTPCRATGGSSVDTPRCLEVTPAIVSLVANVHGPALVKSDPNAKTVPGRALTERTSSSPSERPPSARRALRRASADGGLRRRQESRERLLNGRRRAQRARARTARVTGAACV